MLIESYLTVCYILLRLKENVKEFGLKTGRAPQNKLRGFLCSQDVWMLISIRNCTQGTCSRHCLSLCYWIILSLTARRKVIIALLTTWATCASLQWIWTWFWYIKARRLESIVAILCRPNAIALTRMRAGSLACWHLQDIALRAKAIESASRIRTLLDSYRIHWLSNDAGDNQVWRWWFWTMAHLIVSFINLRIPLAELLVRISHAISDGLNLILFALADWCLLILLEIWRSLLLFENWVSQIFADIALSLSLVLFDLRIYFLTEGWRLIWL